MNGNETKEKKGKYGKKINIRTKKLVVKRRMKRKGEKKVISIEKLCDLCVKMCTSYMFLCTCCHFLCMSNKNPNPPKKKKKNEKK